MWVQIELDGTLSAEPIGSVIAYGSKVPENAINVFTEGVPVDYCPERYQYAPNDPTVYDPNGFIPIQPEPEPSPE